MSIERKTVATSHYKGHTIKVKFLGPDLICEVDGKELPNFYLNAEATRLAGERHIDELEKVKNKTK